MMAGEDVEGWRFEGEVTRVPACFRRWVQDNGQRIAAARSLPYFIQDNYVDGNPSKGFRWQWHASGTPPKSKSLEKTLLGRLDELNNARINALLPKDIGSTLMYIEEQIKAQNFADAEIRIGRLETAAKRHATRTIEETNSIQFRWSRRRINRIDTSRITSSDVDRFNKLLDMTSLTNEPGFNAAEFNREFNIIARHAARTPEQAQEIRKRWDARCIEQAGETKQLAEMRKAIEKGKITSIADVDRIMQEFYRQFPEEFNNVKIKFTSFNEAPKKHAFTMGWSIHDIEIAFNENKGWDKESPLERLIKALEKVRTGKKLNLEQHRSISTVVHELLHQKAKHYVRLNPHYSGDYKRTAMETMNELASRATTVRFLRRIGGNTDGVMRLIKSGNGYTNWVSRVLEFCDKAGVNPERLGQSWATILTTESYDTMDAQLYSFFRIHSDKKGFTQSMDEALEIFEDDSPAGKRKWKAMLKKWFPNRRSQ